MKKMLSGVRMKSCLLAVGLSFLMAAPAMAQISNKAINKHDQLKKQSLKEASQTDASYKDTHLNMDVYTFRKGEAAKADKRSPIDMLRPAGAPDKETVQRKSVVREKRFRLFRKKNKTN